MKNSSIETIKNEDQLMEAIKYTHTKCFELCKKNFGRYLPVAGNMGIFCHSDSEYEFLTKLRKELTDESDNWNQKYYRLYKPITIPSQGEIPGATYTYLYIRKPDQHKEVGDVDFVLNKEEYLKLKDSLLKGAKIKGMEILDRPNLDLIKLSDSDINVLSFIGSKDMAENVEAKG